MDYIYDIVLNFQERYYDFYEWNLNDKLINFKKIPIYKIKTKDYINIKNNDIIIDRKSLSKNNRIFLLTNGIEVMGILLNNQGKVLKRSSLIFEENDEIIEDQKEIKLIDIKYHINNLNKTNYQSRINIEKYNYVSKYLKNLYKKQDIYLLKYLYYLIFTKEESNMKKIKKELSTLIDKDIKRVYLGIEKFNQELKKLPIRKF